MGFKEGLREPAFAMTERMNVLQINVGSKCNMSCRHCHVQAGPLRTEEMGKDVLKACLQAYQSGGFQTIDITGGAPEMNPYLEWFLEEATQYCKHMIVRTNLTILQEKPYRHFMDIYAKNQIELVASLPCYTAENTDAQRGNTAFEKSIATLKELNQLGYGKEEGLVLNLVYNPGGAFLPASQEALEQDYKKVLKEEYGIVFDHLFALANNPIGRFKEELQATGQYEDYIQLLKANYNAATERNMMCRFQISVGYDGKLYDCDFNQAEGLQIKSGLTVFDIAAKGPQPREIIFRDHCYGCTAGNGSSCGGAIG